MGHTDNFNQTERTADIEVCPVCKKEHTSLAFLIPGVGFACSQECVDDFAAENKKQMEEAQRERIAEEMQEMKQALKDKVNDEILPSLTLAKEMLETDEVQTVIQEATPLVQEVAKQYGNIIGAMLPQLAVPIARMKAQAVAELEEAGFTREEAIALMSS